LDLAVILAAIHRWWLTILVATLVGGLAGWFAASAMTPTYESQTRVLVGPVAADFDTARGAAGMTTTYARLATSDTVLSMVIERLGLPESPLELRERISATPDGDARIVTIAASADDGQAAAALAAATAAALADLSADPGTTPAGAIQVVEAPVPGESPVAPQALLTALLAAFAALAGALLLVSVIELLDDKVRSVAQLRSLVDLPVAGIVPVTQGSDPPVELLALDPMSKAAGQYRALAAALPGGVDETGSVVVVADAEGGRYSEEVAANLAAAALGRGLRVRLIDAREDRPLQPDLIAELQEAMPSIRSTASAAGPRTLRFDSVSSLAAGDLATLVGERHGDGASGSQPGLAGDGRLVVVDIGDGRESLHGRRWVAMAGVVALVSAIGDSHRAVIRDLVDRVEPLTTAPLVLVGAERIAASSRRGPRVVAQSRGRIVEDESGQDAGAASTRVQ
jgi:capsular polysaccharide biosynthesis protein